MKIVTVTQNGRDWHKWRGTGLGASEAAAILGVSPWTSPFELWLEKTGLCEKAPANEFSIAAMKRGLDLEPLARKRFEAKMGILFPPLSAEHDQHPFIRASFDGYCETLNAILEIKCPGKADHSKALAGGVPSKYVPQIQHQLLVSGALKCYYFSFDGMDSEALIEVKPDPAYINDLKNKLIHFWNLVELQLPPQISSQDMEKFVKRVSNDFKRLGPAIKALELLVSLK
jgi:putative phage-type endonuclease